MVASDEPEELRSNLSRRQWIQLVGTTAITAALAGCSGDDGNGNLSGGIGEIPQVDKPLISRFSTQPSNAQWNMYNTNNQAAYGLPLLFSPLAWFSTKQNEFVPFLAEDWEWVEEGTHFRLHLGDFWTWHNGESFTSQDVVTKLKLEQHLGGLDEIVDTVEANGEYTVDIRTTDTIANYLLELKLFTQSAPEHINTPHSSFGDLLQAIEDTKPDTDARNQALAEVAQFKFQPPVGTGPFKQQAAQEGRIVLKPFEDYPYEQLQQQIEESDHLEYTFPEWAMTSPNFPAVHLQYFADGSALRQAWFTGNIDIGSDAPPEGPEIVEQYPSTHTMTLRPSYRGSCLCFKLDHNVFGNPEIRRAMAHTIDVPAIAQTTYGATGFANTSASGMPKALAQQWLADDFRNNTLTSYVEQNFEAARAEMQSLADHDSGFANQGGTWTYQGNPITVTLTAPAIVSSHMNAMRQLQSWFDEIGLKTQIRGVEGSQIWSQTMPNGDYTVAQNYFGGGQPHPYYSYRNTWIDGNLIGDTHNPPKEVTVPPVGKSSGEMTVNVRERTQALGKPSSEEEQKKIVRELAWVWNQTLPYVPYAERHNAWMEDMGRFHFGHPDDKAQSLQRNPFFQVGLGMAIARKNPVSVYPYDKKYLSIDGQSVNGGMSLKQSKSQIPGYDQSF